MSNKREQYDFLIIGGGIFGIYAALYLAKHGLRTCIVEKEKELLKNFEKHGITKMEPLDQLFDPNFHEVMFEAPVPGKPAGTVMQVIETGYILHDRLLRPARVGISKDDGTQGGGNTPPHPGGHIDTQA